MKPNEYNEKQAILIHCFIFKFGQNSRCHTRFNFVVIYHLIHDGQHAVFHGLRVCEWPFFFAKIQDTRREAAVALSWAVHERTMVVQLRLCDAIKLCTFAALSCNPGGKFVRKVYY